MKDKIKQRVDFYKDKIVNSVVECIQIPSVISEEDINFTFGEEIEKSLVEALNLCKELGFTKIYKDPEGYYGYAEIGQGEELIGVLGHLDVVPEGDANEWTYPPFSGQISNNKIYGRGAQDDKGPTIASLYAIKSLMDLGVEFNKRVRVIFGTDEENLWRCINKYTEKEEMPNYGFTPDSVFPLINAEKGLLQVKLISKENTNFNFNLGNALNSVPDKAFYNGEKLEELKIELQKLDFKYEKVNDGINVIGFAMHSQSCDKTINAISRLCIALNNIGISCDTIKFIAEVIGEDANANNIINNCQDAVSGKLTFNIGKLQIDKKSQTIGIDIRYPVTLEKEILVNALTKKANEYNLEFNEYDFLKAIYVPEDNFLVKSLMKVYQEETNDLTKPLSSGGATYARALDNCVAFGPTFSMSKKTAHQADEHIDIDELIKATKIYALSIYELLK